jgi:hypothetical protein
MGQTQNPADASPAPATRSLDEIANVVVGMLQAGTWDELAPFWSENAMRRLPPSRVRTLWEAVAATLGPVTSVLPGETTTMDGRTFTKVPVWFDWILVTVTVFFDDASRVDGVAIHRAG